MIRQINRLTAKISAFYVGVFMISALLMALQILQSRIFSVTTWYHLAFLVISVAMFGMTLAALRVFKMDKEYALQNYERLMADLSHKFGWSAVAALLVQLYIPITNHSITGTLMSLPVVSAITVFPYYFAGQILSLALTRTPYPTARTYGVDLVGAAAGCLFALLLMETIDAPSAVLLLAALACLSASFFKKDKTVKTGRIKEAVSLALLCFAGMNVFMPSHLIYPFVVKGYALDQSLLSYDEWNSISRVTVSRENVNALPYIWGPSPDLPEEMRASFYELKIDGDAATPINRFEGDFSVLGYLDYDVSTIAYALPDLKKGAIIGVGGGRDALSQLYYGLDDITAIDINSVQISLLTAREPYKSYAGLANEPKIKFVHDEARSWFTRNQATFDIIQMSLIDTWAATGAGAFALSENGLYTVEAFRTFLKDLNEHGVLTVSRWHASSGENEMQRLLAMATEALLEEGVSEPKAHIFVAKGSTVATLVLGKSPLTAGQLTALRKRVRDYNFETLVDPGHVNDNTLDQVISASSQKALDDVVASQKFDISPPRDTRPFFFNMVRMSQPQVVMDIVAKGEYSSILGHAKATMNLYIILGFALLMVGFVILWPLRKAARQSPPALVANGTVWFFLIGMGFMLLEVSLLQRMSIFLGHPIYSLGIVLFSLVLFTGIGSFISDAFPLDSRRKTLIWALLTAATILSLPYLLTAGFEAFAEGGLLARAALCLTFTSLSGLLMGYGFPTGMALTGAIDNRPTPWFWGINGAAGVLGSVVAVALNISMGLNWTMSLAGICYALLMLPALGLFRARLR